eukprot:3607130-Pleurochrysis_carterae.AAC.1
MMSASTNTHELSRMGEAKRLGDCAAAVVSGFSTCGEPGPGRGDVAGDCGSANRAALAMSASNARLTDGPLATAGRSCASEAVLARWRALSVSRVHSASSRATACSVIK